MERQDRKAKWASYSTCKERLVSGVGALAALGLLGIMDDLSQPQQGPGHGSNGQPGMSIGPNWQMLPAPAFNPDSQPQGAYPVGMAQGVVPQGHSGGYSGVDSGVVGAAVDSGGYTSVPRSELPVAGDGGGDQ